jgi:hypothetical protein
LSATSTAALTHAFDAVGALLSTAYGYDDEQPIAPDDIEWATTRAGALQSSKKATSPSPNNTATTAPTSPAQEPCTATTYGFLVVNPYDMQRSMRQ